MKEQSNKFKKTLEEHLQPKMQKGLLIMKQLNFKIIMLTDNLILAHKDILFFERIIN
jgi:hypothetical protein